MECGDAQLRSQGAPRKDQTRRVSCRCITGPFYRGPKSAAISGQTGFPRSTGGLDEAANPGSVHGVLAEVQVRAELHGGRRRCPLPDLRILDAGAREPARRDSPRAEREADAGASVVPAAGRIRFGGEMTPWCSPEREGHELSENGSDGWQVFPEAGYRGAQPRQRQTLLKGPKMIAPAAERARLMTP